MNSTNSSIPAPPPHEKLVARIRVLERAVVRWWLVSLFLVFVVVALLAIMGTFGLVLLLSDGNRRDIEVLELEADQAREEARRAAEQADRARQELEAERKRLQEVER